MCSLRLWCSRICSTFQVRFCQRNHNRIQPSSSTSPDSPAPRFSGAQRPLVVTPLITLMEERKEKFLIFYIVPDYTLVTSQTSSWSEATPLKFIQYQKLRRHIYTRINCVNFIFALNPHTLWKNALITQNQEKIFNPKLKNKQKNKYRSSESRDEEHTVPRERVCVCCKQFFHQALV